MSNKTFLMIAFVAGILSALCLVAFRLAFHDISSDYVSPKVVQENVSGSPSLPGWTACSLEWKIVRIGFWPMAAFHAILLVGLFRRRNTRLP